MSVIFILHLGFSALTLIQSLFGAEGVIGFAFFNKLFDREDKDASSDCIRTVAPMSGPSSCNTYNFKRIVYYPAPSTSLRSVSSILVWKPF